ncbi:MAG: tetratricopeptide repeat protein [Verrucomicrobia bacterium]|nr:MAG: tetratricopeptide repeat protein [Verrucomicrobiota bacterium]
MTKSRRTGPHGREPLALGLALLVLLAAWPGGGCRREPARPGSPQSAAESASAEDRFVQWMNTGKNYYDQGQTAQAIEAFQKAVELQPTRVDARINLANAFLLANQPEAALEHALKALEFDRNAAAAYYVAGCAHLRLGQAEEAVKMFLPARDLNREVAAVSYLLGRAYQQLGRTEDAMAAYREAIRVDPQHPVAHYALAQLLFQTGQREEAAKELALHQAIPNKPGGSAGPETYERCIHTRALAPVRLEKPDPAGIAVRFVDVTAEVLGAQATNWTAPIAVLDYNRDGRNSLFVTEPGAGFRLLDNRQGRFTPKEPPLKFRTNAPFARALVGDFNNDRFEDVLVIGLRGSQAFRFATNGAARDFTVASGLRTAKLLAADALLIDADITGKLDILALQPDGGGLRLLRNLGNMYFKDITATSGLPANLTGLAAIEVEDWNNDDLLDVFLSRTNAAPLYLQKVRGGPLTLTNLPAAEGFRGHALALGDVNNDGRPDLLTADATHADLLLGGANRTLRLDIQVPELHRIALLDYDNDGWLDLWAWGRGLQVWRNLGDGAFTNRTVALGLEALASAEVLDLAAADFDQDGDTDLALALAGGGLRLWRNEGGNANHQLKCRLLGNRSNASGLGIRIEVAAGSFRAHRTVRSLPVEIGVGSHAKLDAVVARWFDIPSSVVDVTVDPAKPIDLFEPVIPAGSCPYLYAWDGERFRFVSDFLGSSPVGLPISDDRFTEADPFEYLALGGPDDFAPRDGRYVVQITEELREVLYLDQSELVVVDHPADTEVHTTDKLRPQGPFPRGELWTLHHRHPLRKATRLDGVEVTDRLQAVDRVMVSPLQLRPPPYRGLAEPHGVILDFGPLPVDRPLVLALTGWLHFGGGIANVAASHNPELPFPFPRLEVETAPDQWQPVDVTVGAPSGKTKTILVDLTGRLPAGSRRLRLTTAFEIHWDRIALFERAPDDRTRITRLKPTRADLHWRGFSRHADLPWDQPLTPVYDQVEPNPPWPITPMGWCTRYGPVDELVAETDNALVLLNGGDELTLEFDAAALPPLPEGARRSFFIYNVGWDKDADPHVELGWLVDPLPWHGMNDQLYGREPRPELPGDALTEKYRTRWVGQHTLLRAAR